MAPKTMPRALWAYIWLQGLAALGLTAAVFRFFPIPTGEVVPVLLVLVAVFSTWRVELTVARGKMTLTFAVVALALLLQGPLLALVCALVGGLIPTYVGRNRTTGRLELRRSKLHMAVFNLSNCTVSCVLSCFVFQAIVGSTDPFSGLGVLALTCFTASYFLMNTGGVALACALQQQNRVGTVWTENFLWTGPGFFASSSVALGVALLHQRLGLWSLVALPPVWIVYYSYRLYMERLHLFTDKVQRDRDHIAQLNELNQAIIASLATAIDAKDSYTCSHINRVRVYASHLAKAAGLDEGNCQAVETGALVHDIGKLGIPESILAKPGKLTGEEYQRIQKHVDIGVEILSPIPFPFPVLDVVWGHHERWDGLGYPRGLKGEEIPVGARIISIVDMFDALTSDRPYRRALSHEEALQELSDAAGTQLDPQLVELFKQALPAAAVAVAQAEKAERELAEQHPGEGANALLQISQAAAEIAAVTDVARALSNQLSSETIQEVVVSRALALLPVDTAMFCSLAEGQDQLIATTVAGKYAGRLEGMTIDLGEGVSGHAAAHQKAVSNVSATREVGRRFDPEENVELSLASAVPLIGAGRTLGVLTVYTVSYTFLSEHHIQILNILAEHAASAVDHSLRLQHHRDLAHTDPLTGLVNSRGLLETLDDLTARHTPFGMLMMDLDGFKMVNDTLGHLRGDDLLCEVAQILRATVRPDDIACRYAGDEFVVLLPNASEADTDRIASRVRRAISSIRLNSPTPLDLGMSIGGAVYPHDADEAKGLIAAADRRMYEDKFGRRWARSVANDQEEMRVAALS